MNRPQHTGWQGQVLTDTGIDTDRRITITIRHFPNEPGKTWFKLPPNIVVVEGIVNIQGKIKCLNNHLYSGSIRIPGAVPIDEKKNIFGVTNFSSTYLTDATVYAQKGSIVQIHLNEFRVKQPKGAVLQHTSGIIIRFQL